MKNTEQGNINPPNPPEKKPEISPPPVIPDNPSRELPEIKPGKDPDAPVYPPEINPMEPGREIEPEEE